MPYKAKAKKQPKRRWTIVAPLIVVLLLAAGVTAYLLNHHQNTTQQVSKPNVRPENSISYAPPNTSENTSNEDRKSSSSASTTLDNGSTSTSSTPTGNFSVKMTSHPATVNNNNVHIGTLVSGITSGDCALTATQSGQATLQLGTSSVQQDVNDYDCGVFNIPTSNFTHSGTWNLILTVTNDGTSSSDTTTVSI